MYYKMEYSIGVNIHIFMLEEGKHTFRSLENGFLNRNDCSFCLFCEMVTLAKKRPGRRKKMKTRWCCKGSLSHERYTTAPAVERSGGDWGKAAIPDGHLDQKEEER